MVGSQQKIPWGFLLVSFAFSWSIWIPVAVTGRDYQSSPYLLAAVLVGAFGPGLAAIVFVYLSRDLKQINDFRLRVFDFRRIRPGWILIILTLWPVLHTLSIAITKLLGGNIPESPFLEEILQQPSTIPLVLFLYFIQATIEEIGWRGYLQEKLTDPYGPGPSSVMVGLIHAIWHLPLFWVVGTNQIKMGFGMDFWIFIIFVVSTSVYTAWIYLGNRNSILAAALLHTTGNLSFDAFSYAPGTIKHHIYVILMVFGAIGVLFYFTNKRKKQAV
jgi:membrane protease YdiL (CAAX protease family)